MSQLDRAFVKAYARSHTSAPDASGVAKPHLNFLESAVTAPVASPAQDISVQASMPWSGLPDDSYFRVDVGHSQSFDSMSTRNRAATKVSTTATPPIPMLSQAMPSEHLATETEPVTIRLDRPHHARQWAPPTIDETFELRRIQRDAELATEFAKAKLEALAELSAVQESRSIPVTKVQVPPPIPTPAPSIHSRSFEPVWEVDAFEFSDTIVALFGNARLMKSIGAPLDQAVANGLHSLLITSGERGAGRTSVAIGIAVSAAAAGLRVVLVDADATSAALAKTLQMEFQHGWVEAIRNKVPLDEIAVRSIEDQLTVIPAFNDTGKALYTAAEFDRLMSILRDAFDLVIVDGAPWSVENCALQRSTCIDAAIIVVDTRNRDDKKIVQIQDDLRDCGVAGLGIVENFT